VELTQLEREALFNAYRNIQSKAATSIDPVSAARAFQGSEDYPGIDSWEPITLPKGTVVAGGVPGQGHFYTPNETLLETGTNAKAYNEGLQISKDRFPTYRSETRLYELNYDVNAAQSIAVANTGNGPGGFKQYYIPDYENALTPITTIQMTNIK
jgi:hypothetical protein